MTLLECKTGHCIIHTSVGWIIINKHTKTVRMVNGKPALVRSLFKLDSLCVDLLISDNWTEFSDLDYIELEKYRYTTIEFEKLNEKFGEKYKGI